MPELSVNVGIRIRVPANVAANESDEMHRGSGERAFTLQAMKSLRYPQRRLAHAFSSGWRGNVGGTVYDRLSGYRTGCFLGYDFHDEP